MEAGASVQLCFNLHCFNALPHTTHYTHSLMVSRTQPSSKIRTDGKIVLLSTKYFICLLTRIPVSIGNILDDWSVPRAPCYTTQATQSTSQPDMSSGERASLGLICVQPLCSPEAGTALALRALRERRETEPFNGGIRGELRSNVCAAHEQIAQQSTTDSQAAAGSALKVPASGRVRTCSISKQWGHVRAANSVGRWIERPSFVVAGGVLCPKESLAR
jgi:hypothetical protein